jgi:hypothetical protein
VLKLRQITTTSTNFAQPEQTTSSSSNNKQSNNLGGGSTAFKLFALTLTGFTLGIGYAVLNPEARRQIEATVPQSSFLFNSIDGYLNQSSNGNNNNQKKESLIVDFQAKTTSEP